VSDSPKGEKGLSEIPGAADSPTPVIGSTARVAGTTRSKLTALTHTSIAACGGNACVVTWRGGWGEGLLCVPAGSRWRAALDATLAAMERQLEPSCAPDYSLYLNSAQLVKLLAGAVPDDQRFNAVARTSADGPNRVLVMLIAPHGRALAELGAIASLAADNALALIGADSDSNRRDFWRRRAIKTAEQLAKAKSDLSEAATQRRGLDQAVSSALRLSGRNRFARLGSIFARMGPFDAWIVAALEDDELRPVAASATVASIPTLDKNSAIADSLRRKSTIRRTNGEWRAPGYHEDRLFAGFSSYFCVPFESGAVALAASV